MDWSKTIRPIAFEWIYNRSNSSNILYVGGVSGNGNIDGLIEEYCNKGKKVIDVSMRNTHYKHENNEHITNELEKAGWTLDNNNILETIKNWKNTLPKFVIDECLNNCWKPYMNKALSKKITLKKNDKVWKTEEIL